MSYTLALGPFMTAWRGPQRLVLKVACERVTDVDFRTGYNERSCAERLSRLDLDEALHLVTRICGTCSHAHALAFCQALEALLDLPVPARAAYLRSAGAELERLASHLGALHALFEALNIQRPATSLQAFQIQTRQALQALSGRPSLPNICLLGGVRRHLDDKQRGEILGVLAQINQGLFRLADKVIDQRALLARTVEVGVMSQEAARQFGMRGPLARASGLKADLRIDQPYAAYARLEPRLVSQEGGDVYARLVVLLLECIESVRLTDQALQDLPGGEWQGTVPKELRAGQSEGAVEAPRGLLRYRIECDGRQLTSVAIDAPRQLDRLTARTLLSGALIDNTALIALSTDPCPACAEC